jgi:hypothetical protein
MIKALKKQGIEGTYLNIMKGVYDKRTANITLNREKLKSISLKSGMRLSLFADNMILYLKDTKDSTKKKKRFHQKDS